MIIDLLDKSARNWHQIQKLIIELKLNYASDHGSQVGLDKYLAEHGVSLNGEHITVSDEFVTLAILKYS
jgi:hypothetical protein